MHIGHDSLRRALLVLILSSAYIYCIFNPTIFLRITGHQYNPNSNDIIEWNDDYHPPHLSCELEPRESNIAQSQDLHEWHWPKACHKLIAQNLLASSEIEEHYAHAAYHQIMSGEKFLYVPIIAIWRPEWRRLFKTYGPEPILEDAIIESKRTQQVVYNGYNVPWVGLDGDIALAGEDLRYYQKRGSRFIVFSLLALIIVFFIMLNFLRRSRFW